MPGPEGEPTGGEQEIGMEQESAEEWKEATTLTISRDEESLARAKAREEFVEENPRPSDEAKLVSRVVDGEYQVGWNTKVETGPENE